MATKPQYEKDQETIKDLVDALECALASDYITQDGQRIPLIPTGGAVYKIIKQALATAKKR